MPRHPVVAALKYATHREKLKESYLFPDIREAANCVTFAQIAPLAHVQGNFSFYNPCLHQAQLLAWQIASQNLSYPSISK